MDILFVNYGDFTTNSINHIGAFATGLVRLGHRCAVAVPDTGSALDLLPRRDFIPMTFEEALRGDGCFGAKGPDIVHAWTPREVVREFIVHHARCRTVPVVVHLEDDEFELAAAFTRRSPEELARVTDLEWRRLAPPALSHPTRYRSFLRCADGLTVITGELLRDAPPATPHLVLPPGLDLAFHAVLPPDPELRAQLGVDPDESLLVFPGSTTFANRADNHTLLRAVALVRQRGRKLRLVRTGHHPTEHDSGIEIEWRSFTIDLGFLPKSRLPPLLALADVLVQPGAPNAFNRRRLPSKLPELLASGRPVVTTDVNLGAELRDGIDALLLHSGTAEEIAYAVERVLDDPELARTLGRNGRAFAERRFDLDERSRELAAFYRAIQRATLHPRLSTIRGTRLDDDAALTEILAKQDPAQAQAILASRLAARADLMHALADLQGELTRAREELARARAEADTARHERNLAAAAQAALSLQRNAMSRELDELREHDRRLTTRLAELDILASDTRAARDALAAELEATRTDAACVRARLEEELASTRAARDALTAELEATRTDAACVRARFEEQLADTRAARDALAAELEATRTDAACVRARLEEELASTRAARDALAASGATLEQELRQAETRLAGVRSQLEAAHSVASVQAAEAASERTRLMLELERLRLALAQAEARAAIERDRADRNASEKAELRRTLASELDDSIAIRAKLDGALGSAREELRLRQAELERAEASLASLRAELELSEGRRQRAEAKVVRMQSSLSWRVTAPLRAVRRRLLDPRRQLAPAPPPSPVLAASTVPEDAARLPDVPWNVHLDEPRKPGHLYRFGHLIGWAFPPGGRAPDAFRLILGETVVAQVEGTARPDVAHHFGDPAAERCGFRFDLAITGAKGPTVLHLEGRLPGGRWQRFQSFPVEVADVPPEPQPHDYEHWIRSFDTFDEDEERGLLARLRAAPWLPKLSVIVPTFNTPERWLRRMLDSVREQVYGGWELCLADDASSDPRVRAVLGEYAAADPRIRVVQRTTNGHISAASNTALALASGDYAVLLDHDDELPRYALALVALEIAAHPEADIVYSDEDKIDERGRRYDPYFKPDWNPDLFLGHNMISHLGVYRLETVRAVGGFREGFEGSQDWDLALRIVERTRPERIRHIPRVLYHWRAIPGSTALAGGEKHYAFKASRRALEEHLQRTRSGATLEVVRGHIFRIRYPLPEPRPRVSIIIPTRNRVELLKVAVGSILEKTTYDPYEILVVDNGSDDPATLEYLGALARDRRVRVLPMPGPFNYSRLNNNAVAQASGTVLALVNNDIEVITSDWLEEMVSHALRPGVGAVGAKLLYPDGTIQHAGVLLGVGGIANHAFRRFPRDASSQMNRIQLVQEYSAVTAACLVVRKDLYLEVGGLDADNLEVAFNDVDFCLRLRSRGHRCVYTPFAELFHHESASRGRDLAPEAKRRFEREIATMQRRWADLIRNDPAYNRNLTRSAEDFSLRYAWESVEAASEV